MRFPSFAGATDLMTAGRVQWVYPEQPITLVGRLQPDADVADKLLELAESADNRTFRRWALRAYIRVVTLKSDRPEAETLAIPIEEGSGIHVRHPRSPRYYWR